MKVNSQLDLVEALQVGNEPETGLVLRTEALELDKMARNVGNAVPIAHLSEIHLERLFPDPFLCCSFFKTFASQKRSVLWEVLTFGRLVLGSVLACLFQVVHCQVKNLGLFQLGSRLSLNSYEGEYSETFKVCSRSCLDVERYHWV